MPTPRYAPGAAGLDGLLYVVGGTIGFGRLQTALEAYDPASDTWTARAPMPTARANLAVAVVDGILYAVGGDNFGTVEAYDPATDTWTTKAPMPTPRSELGVAAIDGIIYAVGGETSSPNSLTTLEAYDPATDPWTTKTPMPTWDTVEMVQFAVAAAGGRLYAAGGNDGTGYFKEYRP